MEGQKLDVLEVVSYEGTLEGRKAKLENDIRAAIQERQALADGVLRMQGAIMLIDELLAAQEADNAICNTDA